MQRVVVFFQGLAAELRESARENIIAKALFYVVAVYVLVATFLGIPSCFLFKLAGWILSSATLDTWSQYAAGMVFIGMPVAILAAVLQKPKKEDAQ